MARTVKVSDFQRMMTAEQAADRAANHDVATVDPLSGQLVDAKVNGAPGFRSPAMSVAEQLQSLTLEDDIAGMPLGQIVGLIRLAVEAAHVNATEPEIRAEAERRWLDHKLEEMPVDPKPDEQAERMAARAEGAVSAMATARITVDGSGSVVDVRPAEMTPDRGDGVGETHHTITDADPRFSGGGADDDPEPSRLIPTDGAFFNERHKAAPELANLAEKLIDEHGFLERLRHCRIDYKWRRKGTNSNGKRAIGKLERVSGIWSAYVPYSFVIWLAADTARLAQFSDRQVEAALFHQLAHIDQDAKGNWIRIGHDFEGFGSEVRHYGPWTEDLKIGSQAFTVAVQLGLDMDADDEEDERAEEDGATDEYDSNDYMGDGPSGLDCRECGGAIDLERPSRDGLCRPCREAEQAERNPEGDDILADPAVI